MFAQSLSYLQTVECIPEFVLAIRNDNSKVTAAH
jgi:hypothetical protein